MRILIAGGSGFIGHALVPALRAAGHDVRRLVRRTAEAADEVAWNPVAGELDPAALADVDAIINLAGENIAGGRWTARRRLALQTSRLESTRTLVAALAQTPRRDRVLLSASATGFYGDRAGELLDERSPGGGGFLAELCRDWEAAAVQAEAVGVRVACLRFGIVLGQDGGALAKMLPAFRAGLGGRLGSGNQWMSWIHLDDLVAVILHALADDRYRGPINVVAPEPVTNRAFACALAATLQRPAVIPVPTLALRLLFGQMADEALLASNRVAPARLTELGYDFRYPTLAAALKAAAR